MSLMIFVRSFAALVLGWILVALGIGAMGGVPTRVEIAAPQVELPVRHDLLSDTGPVPARSELVDRVTGKSAPLRLPTEDQWTNLSISPSRDATGDEEVVGRWVSRGQGAFCGMGSFRLSDGAVLSRVPMEILPIGRPCWIPGQPRSILFSAGDGRLHRCQLPVGDHGSGMFGSASDDSGQGGVIALEWEVRPPGSGRIMLADPVWSSDPRLRNWVIVALSQQNDHPRHARFRPARLWWLELSEQADTILAAGRLTAPAIGAVDDDEFEERYPNIAIGPGRDVRLVYLTRDMDESSWRLRSAGLRFDTVTGHPRLEPESEGKNGPGEGLKPAPFVVSADARQIFGLDRSGRVKTLSLMTEKTGQGEASISQIGTSAGPPPDKR